MSEIDNRIVQMRFDNNQFEAGVSKTLESLDLLKESLNFEGAVTGIDSIASSMSAISDRFSMVGMIGVAAMQKISSQIVDATEKALRFASGIDQITAGFSKFEQKTTAVGTLVAQGFSLEEVNEQLDRLNWFTDETSYNFTDMVESIGKFTATGKGLTESVDAMEGIALWAALSGQNAQKASHAMYQLSQALGSGYMRKEDYKSIQNLSMDTDEFRQIALDTAVALGTLKKTGEDTYKSLTTSKGEFTKAQFAEHLTEDAWFTSDVMMEVYKKYASATQKIYDYAKQNNVTASQAIEAVGDQVDQLGLKALKAGQEARTFSDVMSAVSDTVATSWMQTFTYIFGDYDEAVALWTDLVNRIIEVTDTFGSLRNGVLETWKELGGRDDLISAYTDGFDGLTSIAGNVAEAFISIIKPTKEVDELMEELFGLSSEGDKLINTIKKLRNQLSRGIIPDDIGRQELEELYDQLYEFESSSFLIRFTKNLKESASGFKEFYSGGRSSEEILADIQKYQTLLATDKTKTYDYDLKIGDLQKELAAAQLSEAGLLSLQSHTETISKAVKLFGTALSGITEVVSVIFKNIGQLVEPIGNLVDSLFNLVDALLDTEDKLDVVKTTFSGIAEVLDGLLSPAFKALGDIINWLADQIDRVTASIITGESPLAKALQWVVTTINNFLEGFRTNMNPIKESLNIVENWINQVAKIFGGAGTNAANSIGVLLGVIAKNAAAFLGAFFDTAGVLQWSKIFDLLGKLAQTTILVSIANGFYNVTKSLELVPKVMEAVKNAIESVTKAFGSLKTLFNNVAEFFAGNKGAINLFLNSPAIDSIVKNLRNLAVSFLVLAAALYLIGQVDADRIAAMFATLVTVITELVGALIILDKVLDDSDIVSKKGPFGIFETISKGSSTKTATSGLLNMAAAVLVLAFAMKVISDIDPERLTASVFAISLLMGEMVAVTKALSEMGKLGKDQKKFQNVTKGLIAFAAAIYILALAVKQIASLELDQVLYGVGAISVLIFEMSAFMNSVKDTKVLITSAIAMILLAGAIRAMSESVAFLGGLDIETLVKGLVALGLVMVELSLFAEKLDGAKILVASIGLMVVVSCLKAMSEIIAEFGEMDPGKLALGLIATGVALIELCAALAFFGDQKALDIAKMVIAAAALNSVVGALQKVSKVIQTLGNMDSDSLGFGLLGMGAALVILGGGLMFIGSNALKIILGAVALEAASLSLITLGTAFTLFRNLDLESVTAALVAIGGVLLEVGIALAAFGMASAPMLAGIGVMIALAAALGLVAGIIIGIGTAFLGLVKQYADSSGALVDAVNAISKIDDATFKSKMASLGVAYAEFGKSLSMFDWLFGKGQAEAMKLVSEGIVTLAPALEQLSKIDDPEKLNSVLGYLAEGINQFGRANQAFGLGLFAQNGANAFKGLSEGINILYPAIRKLSTISDGEQIERVFDGLAYGIMSFGLAIKTYGPLANIGATASSKIAESVPKLADAVVKIKDIPAEDIKTIMTSIATAFAQFGKSLGDTPLFFSNDRAQSIVTLVESVDKLVDGLKKMQDIPTETVKTSLDKIGDAFKKFGEAISGTTFWSPKNRAEGIAILIDSVDEFCEVVPKLQELNSEDISSSMDVLGEAYKTLGASLYSAPVIGAADAGTGIAAIAGSIDEFAEGINKFKELETTADELDSILTTISTAFKNFAEAIKGTGFWAEGKATGISTLVDSTGTLATAIADICSEDLDADKFSTTLGAIGEAYKKFGSAIMNTGFWAEGKGEGLSTVAESTVSLANALKTLGEAKNVEESAGHISSFFTKLSAALNTTLYVEQKAEAIATVCTAMRDSLVPTIQAFADISTNKLSSAMTGIEESLTTLKNSLLSFAGEDGVNAGVAEQILTAVTSVMDSLSNYNYESVNNFGSNIITNIISGVETEKESLYNLIYTVGEESGNKLSTGISDNEEKVKTAAEHAANEGVKAAKTKESEFYEVGKNYMIGMANGIDENAYMVKASASVAASQAKQAAEDALGIESPSKVGHQIGAYFDIGMANGITDFATYVGEAASSMATAIPAMVAEPMLRVTDALNSGMQFTPSITPVVDIDNAAYSASRLGKMFDANKLRMDAASMKIDSQVDQMDDLVRITGKIYKAVENGSFGNTYNFNSTKEFNPDEYTESVIKELDRRYASGRSRWAY